MSMYQAQAIRVIELGDQPKHRRRSSATSTTSTHSIATPYTATPTRKLVIVGDGAAGKTSLLQKFVKAADPNCDYTGVDSAYTPTVFDSYSVAVQVDGVSIELSLWDTAGQEDYDRLRPLSYSEADAVLIAYAVDHEASLRNVVDKWAPEIRHYLPACPITLVGLKADLRENGHNGQISTWEEGERVKERIGAEAFLECSAKTGHNVNQVFLQAVRTMSASKHKRQGSLLKRVFSCFPPFAEPQVID